MSRNTGQFGNAAVYGLTFLPEQDAAERTYYAQEMSAAARTFWCSSGTRTVLEGDDLTLLLTLHTPYRQAPAAAEELLDLLTSGGAPVTGGLLREARAREQA